MSERDEDSGVGCLALIVWIAGAVMFIATGVIIGAMWFPQEIEVERVVERERIVHRDVPGPRVTVEVEKIVTVEKPVERIVTVEKVVEKRIQVPVEKLVYVDRVVERLVYVELVPCRRR